MTETSSPAQLLGQCWRFPIISGAKLLAAVPLRSALACGNYAVRVTTLIVSPRFAHDLSKQPHGLAQRLPAGAEGNEHRAEGTVGEEAEGEGLGYKTTPSSVHL